MSVDYDRFDVSNRENGRHTRSHGMGVDVAAGEIELSGHFSHDAPGSRYSVHAAASTNLRTTIANTRFESEGLDDTDYLNARFDGALQFNNHGVRADGTIAAGVGLDVQNTNANLQSSFTAQGQIEFGGGPRRLETATVGAINTNRLTFQQLPFPVQDGGFIQHTTAVEGTYAAPPAGTGWVIQRHDPSWAIGYAPRPRAIENGPANPHGYVEEVEESSSEEE